jgi:uridine kinase
MSGGRLDAARATAGRGAEDKGGRHADAGESWEPPVGEIAGLIRRAEPRLGRTTLVLIDGPSGAGKTTLAVELAEVVQAQRVPTDDLLNGWDDQFTYWPRLEDQVLGPVRAGEKGKYQRYDWHSGQFTREWIPVEPGGVLIVEGVGAGREEGRKWASVTIFVDAPLAVREARSLARDGEAMQVPLRQWRRREELHFAADATAWCADVVIGSGS